MTGQKAYYEIIADRLIQQLEEGTAPWQKPWKPGMERMPHNPVSGTRYKGANALWLAMQGRSDPRWVTYKQAQKLGAQVQKGEKSTWVQYWKFTDEVPRKDEQGNIIIDGKGNPMTEEVVLERPKVFSSRVFNAEQIQGLPPLETKEPAWNRHERSETILAGSGAEIRHDQPDQAFYRPSTDSIHLPGHEQFETADNYYATALHELGHWTGHASRMDRDLSGGFGSDSYAKEELRAEIASLMVGDELGTGHDPGQHAAYVKSWIKVLRDDPKEILRASRDAEKIMSLVMSYEKERVQADTREPDNHASENIYNVVAGAKTVSYTDAREAGAAFFNAERKEQPYVIHEMDGNKGRIMAGTAIAGTYANGERRFLKSLPKTHEADADFRAGYFDALEISVTERLKKTDWEKVKPTHPSQTPKLDSELYEDLEMLSKVDFKKSSELWNEHIPSGTAAPAFVDPEGQRQRSELLEMNKLLSRKLAEKVAVGFPDQAARDSFMRKVEDRLSQGQQTEKCSVTVKDSACLQDVDQER